MQGKIIIALILALITSNVMLGAELMKLKQDLKDVQLHIDDIEGDHLSCIETNQEEIQELQKEVFGTTHPGIPY